MERGSDALVVRSRLAAKSAICFLLWLSELLSLRLSDVLGYLNRLAASPRQ